MKKFVLTLLGLVSFVTPAWAQNDYPRGEVFLGYSYANIDVIADRVHAAGFEISGAGNLHRNWGLEGDVSGHFGSLGGSHFQNWLFLGGPRAAKRFHRATPFAHALFGANHFRIAGESSTDFAMAYGGGLDVNVSDHVALRAVQADYVYIRFSEAGAHDNSHSVRLSFGLTFLWGR